LVVADAGEVGFLLGGAEVSFEAWREDVTQKRRRTSFMVVVVSIAQRFGMDVSWLFELKLDNDGNTEG